MGEPVAILGVGLLTAVGLTTAETAASARAGTMRFTASDFHDRRFRPFTLAQIPDDALPDLADAVYADRLLTAREQRMLRMATLPLRECLAPLAGFGTEQGLPLCLALPETATTRPLDRAVFVRRLNVQTGGLIDAEKSDASHSGRAGGLLAIGQAVIALRSGAASFVIAGAVDTYRDPYVLGTLDLEGRVKSEANGDAFIPGEGAAFVLLSTLRAAAERRIAPIATVSPVAAGFEPGHMYSSEPYRGEGLANAVAQLVASGAVDSPVADVYSSMNGESHWAKEWGVAYLRNRAAFQDAHGIHEPVTSFGDTGAACGPLLVGLAASAIRAGYRRAPALVYGSSDRGQRAAVIVAALAH